MFNMNNEQEQKIIAFIQWLPQNIQRFEGMVSEETIREIASAKSVEEVAAALDKLSKEQGGNEIIPHMVKVFQESRKTGIFKKGGKLEQLLNKYEPGGKIKTTVKKRTDVNERTTHSSVPRGGEAILTEYPDGTKKYTLTRNEQGFMSNEDGTYFPKEESSIVITERGDTTGYYVPTHIDALLPRKTYTTQYSSDQYKLNHPFWGLAPKAKTRVIPENWWDAFERNFGLKRK